MMIEECSEPTVEVSDIEMIEVSNTTEVISMIELPEKYNPQNEMFRLLGTKRSFSQNETFFFSHP